MKKNMSVILAVFAAAAVVFVGVRSFACDKVTKTANNYGTATYATKAGSGCNTQKSSGSEMTATEKPSCGSRSNWTANLCGTKGYYAANVYTVRDGQMFAVCQGKTFEVTAKTPFVQVDEARYYFADEASKIQCHETMNATVPAIDREVVSLATTEANVVDLEDGQKIAQCPVTGQKFIVTADSPARVVDGQKYYMSAEQSLSTISMPGHQ